MRLEEYLTALQECPDEKLTEELGIYDNWSIFLNADFNQVVEHLEQSGKYKATQKFQRKEGILMRFDYVPGTVRLQVFSWVLNFFVTGSGYNNTKEEQKESERQLRDYSMTIMLHPYQDRKMESVPWLRALAIVAEDLGQYVLKEKIPACMPMTIGTKYFHKKDFSRIVYYDPKGSD